MNNLAYTNANIDDKNNHQEYRSFFQDSVNNKQLRTELVANAYKLAQEYTVESCAKKLADVILLEDEKH